jgi:hypothetical protein
VYSTGGLRSLDATKTACPSPVHTGTRLRNYSFIVLLKFYKLSNSNSDDLNLHVFTVGANFNVRLTFIHSVFEILNFCRIKIVSH